MSRLRHRELLLASVFALALTGAAGAADLAVKSPIVAPVPVFSWTGFYLGIGGGTAWGTKEYDWNADSTIASVQRQIEALEGPLTALEAPPGDLGFIPPLGLHSQGSHNINGGYFGGQIGYDHQFGWFVLGIQADAHWANIEGSGNCFALAVTNCNAEVESFGSVTGRIGGAIDRLLVYVKGGFAWESGKSDINVLGLTNLNIDFGRAGVDLALASSVDEDRTGWTWGVGTEYAFSPNWSGFVEYSYYDFGTENQNYVYSISAQQGDILPRELGLSVPIPTELKEQFHVVKAGINYRFNWGAPLVARY